MHAFLSRMRAAVRARKEHLEQEAAARAIDEARAEIGGVAGDSDDDTAPPNRFDDILNEVCDILNNFERGGAGRGGAGCKYQCATEMCSNGRGVPTS